MPTFNVEFTRSFTLAVEAASADEAQSAADHALTLGERELNDWAGCAGWDAFVAGTTRAEPDHGVVNGEIVNILDARGHARRSAEEIEAEAKRIAREARDAAAQVPLPIGGGQ